MLFGLINKRTASIYGCSQRIVQLGNPAHMKRKQKQNGNNTELISMFHQEPFLLFPLSAWVQMNQYAAPQLYIGAI